MPKDTQRQRRKARKPWGRGRAEAEVAILPSIAHALGGSEPQRENVLTRADGMSRERSGRGVVPAQAGGEQRAGRPVGILRRRGHRQPANRPNCALPRRTRSGDKRPEQHGIRPRIASGRDLARSGPQPGTGRSSSGNAFQLAPKEPGGRRWSGVLGPPPSFGCGHP